MYLKAIGYIKVNFRNHLCHLRELEKILIKKNRVQHLELEMFFVFEEFCKILFKTGETES